MTQLAMTHWRESIANKEGVKLLGAPVGSVVMEDATIQARIDKVKIEGQNSHMQLSSCLIVRNMYGLLLEIKKMFMLMLLFNLSFL